MDGGPMSEQVTISCLACGSPMVERINRLNASTFMGCSRYPDCTETQKVPAWLEVKRAGGIELPGLES
jgi:ssDNA-binding Zn-finger/Zn-ribbon topoisomerase 1